MVFWKSNSNIRATRKDPCDKRLHVHAFFQRSSLCEGAFISKQAVQSFCVGYRKSMENALYSWRRRWWLADDLLALCRTARAQSQYDGAICGLPELDKSRRRAMQNKCRDQLDTQHGLKGETKRGCIHTLASIEAPLFTCFCQGLLRTVFAW